MIKNEEALNLIIESWNGVEALRGKVRRAILGSMATNGFSAIFAADAAHNLPFLHAYSVLNEVLLQLEKEGHFKCRSIFIGGLLSSSKEKLSWIDYDLINKGKDLRNMIAHKGEVIPRKECWLYIDAIKQQLVDWDIICSN